MIQDCLGLVHWNDPERCYGEGGGRGVQDWEFMYTSGGFMSMYGKINTAEIDVILELSCFCDDPVDVGNLISGSSAFFKTSLNIRKSRFTYC